MTEIATQELEPLHTVTISIQPVAQCLQLPGNKQEATIKDQQMEDGGDYYLP